MRKIIIFALIFIMVGLIGARYYIVNKEFPTKYYEQRYPMNEWVHLQDFDFKINSYKMDIAKEKQGQSNEIDIKTDVSIKNTSDKVIDLSKVLKEHIASIGIIPSDYSEVIWNSEDETKLKVGQELNKSIDNYFYNVILDKIQDSDDIRFNISRQFYSSDVKKYFENGKLYSKYIEVGKWGG